MTIASLVGLLLLSAPFVALPPFIVEDVPEASISATNLDQIRAVEAHQYATGRNVLVAVIDTGINLAHPHFAGARITTYNVADGTEDVTDTCQHGTAVAGILTDVAPNVDILAVKAFTVGCYAAYSALAQGIVYATDKGAPIILISAGGENNMRVLADAVAYASVRGVLVVAAAGNRASDKPFYPAAYAAAEAIAGVDSSDRLYDRSNYGDYIGLAAPAVQIRAPYDDGMALFSGTSMAAPHVAGVAAMLLELQPELTVGELRDILTRSAVDLGAPGRDDHYGYGRVDALAAVMALPPIPMPTTRQWLPWVGVHNAVHF